MIVVDKLCYRSKLRYINAGEKFAFAVITLAFVVISRSLLVAALALLVNGVLTVKKGGVRLGQYLRLLSIPLIFLLVSTLAIIVNVSRVPLDAYAVPIGGFFITGSTESLGLGVQLIGTAIAAVSCLYFLSLNTTMTDILGVLERLHCPELLTELMLLIYRFIFVLMETASAIMVSQKARLGYKDVKTSVLSFGRLCAGLFIKSLQRSNALYDAMESRCYDGKIKVLREQHPPKRSEVIAIILFEFLLLGLTIWRRTR